MIPQSYPSLVSHSYAFVHSRAKMYQAHNNKVKVFVPSHQSKTYYFDEIHVQWGHADDLRELLVVFDPDVIAVHSPVHSIYGMLQSNRAMYQGLINILKPRQFFLWIHGYEALISICHNVFAPWEIKRKIKSLLGGWLNIYNIRRFIFQAEVVVYPSVWMKTLAEHYSHTKNKVSTVIIPNPVDTELFQYSTHNSELRSKGVSVRNLDWKYGLDIAINAYSKLEETNLTILGTGRLESYLKKLAQKLESNVSFIGTSKKHKLMPKFLSQFGYFIAPSRTEAQGVAMCEAMAAGLPIIASNVGGIPEFVKNEDTGLLVPPENPAQLRKAITRLIHNPSLYSQLSANARVFAEETLSSDVVYASEVALFNQGCKNREVPNENKKR